MGINRHSFGQEHSVNTDGKGHDTNAGRRTAAADGEHDVAQHAGEYRGWQAEYKSQ